jgi:hypothetical protein
MCVSFVMVLLFWEQGRNKVEEGGGKEWGSEDGAYGYFKSWYSVFYWALGLEVS